MRVRTAGVTFPQSWWAVIVIGVLASVILYQRWEYTHPSRPDVLKAGEQLPPIAVKSLGGQTVRIDWKDHPQPTVLYVFKPDCVWCSRNLEAIRTVQAGASGYRLIGLAPSNDGLKEYVEQNHLTFPVYFASSKGSLKALKITGTPETIVISPAGVVQKVLFGACAGKTGQEVEKMFGVRLPAIGG